MTTGEKIRYLREKKGITQDDLAKAAGYKDRSSIAKIESGGNDPSQRMLLKIANVLEVSPAELLEETPINMPEHKEQTEPPDPSYIPIKYPETRTLATGFEKMTKAQREKLLNFAKDFFEECFDEE